MKQAQWLFIDKKKSYELSMNQWSSVIFLTNEILTRVQFGSNLKSLISCGKWCGGNCFSRAIECNMQLRRKKKTQTVLWRMSLDVFFSCGMAFFFSSFWNWYENDDDNDNNNNNEHRTNGKWKYRWFVHMVCCGLMCGYSRMNNKRLATHSVF